MNDPRPQSTACVYPEFPQMGFSGEAGSITVVALEATARGDARRSADLMRLAEQIVLRPVAQLVPYARNSRTHSPAQISQIEASIKEFGFTNPVLVDSESGIIAGHARVMAAQQLGLEQVPTIELGYLTPAQRQAYIIADNRLAENAGWDRDMLRIELAELRGIDFDLSVTGFGEDDLAALLAERTDGLTDPDDAPPAPENPISVPGDLWILGRHRLLCGDSTMATDVERVLGGVEPHLMVSDPPYGVEYDLDWRNRADRANGKPYGARAVGTVQNDGRADWREAWALFQGDVAYVWHAGRHASAVQAHMGIFGSSEIQQRICKAPVAVSVSKV